MTDSKGGLTRRGFLKGAVVGGGVAAGAATLAVPLSRDPVHDDPYPQVAENHVELPPHGKQVVIIGGGLAGLQAGVELAQRGFKVVILEKSGTPGGKLKSWRDRHWGPADDPAKQDPAFPGYIREHGIHAVWGFYNNLREFLGRHGWPLMEMPDDTSIYHFLDKDGTESWLPNCNWPKPLDKLQLLFSARHMKHLPETDRNDFIRLFLKIGSFDYADPVQREYMDNLSFTDYGRKMGLSEPLINKICDSLIEMAYFDNAHQVSALTLANIFQLVAGSPQDMKVNLYRNAVGESFLQPMVDYIRAHGGEIHYNTEVTRLERGADGNISKVIAGIVAEGQNRIRRCPICGHLIIDGMAHGHECPFCGAHIELAKYLEAHERAERVWEADYYLSALDIPGAQQLVGANPQVLSGEYFTNIQKLHAKAVYVCNLWFEGKGEWEQRLKDVNGKPSICFFATGFQRLGITINRSLRVNYPDGKSIQWSGEFPDRDVTIIETQIAKAEAVVGKSTQEIIDLCYEELKAVLPDLPLPRSGYVNRWHHYNGYKVGTEKFRPPVQSPIDNLLFIGDLAFVPHPAVFMEKTNVTAKWATNLLLEKAGIRDGHIRILMSGTPALTTDLIQATHSVFLEDPA